MNRFYLFLRRQKQIFFIISFSILIIILIFYIPYKQISSNQDISPERALELINEYRRTYAQIFGGAGLLLTLYFAYRRIMATEARNEIAGEGQITERFTRAIDQLGSDKPTIRLGSIYALERIARDSESDHWAIMEILTAYLRENSYPSKSNQLEMNDELRTEIQAVITVLGRRNAVYDWKNAPLDLKGTNLQNITFDDAQFSNARFDRSNFDGTRLIKSVFNNANFTQCKMHGAVFEKSKFIKAHFTTADLKSANFSMSDLRLADLSKADIRRAYLANANLKKSLLIDSDISNSILSNANMQLCNLYNTNLKNAEM